MHLHLSNIDKNSTEPRRNDVITTAWFSHATEKGDMIIEGSLEVKLPTIWTDGKAEVGRVREEKRRREKIRGKERVRRKKMQVRERVAKLCFYNALWLRRVRKVGSLKAAGAEPSSQMRDEQLHAVVARSTFPSQNAQSTSASEHS